MGRKHRKWKLYFFNQRFSPGAYDSAKHTHRDVFPVLPSSSYPPSQPRTLTSTHRFYSMRSWIPALSMTLNTLFMSESWGNQWHYFAVYNFHQSLRGFPNQNYLVSLWNESISSCWAALNKSTRVCVNSLPHHISLLAYDQKIISVSSHTQLLSSLVKGFIHWHGPFSGNLYDGKVSKNRRL